MAPLGLLYLPSLKSTLYKGMTLMVTLAPHMLTMKKLCLLVVLSFGLTGCISVTNLTPSRVARTANGLYPFEVAWRSNQQSLRKDSIKAYVIIDTNSYPMQPTPIVEHRWETLVPIPADKKYVSYRYKFDYDYNSIPAPRNTSKLSPPYELEITEK